MPSPVWLDNDDPDVENFDELLDEFMLDECDDYFDQQPLTKRKRKKLDGDDPRTPSKRQKLFQADKDTGNSAAASVVVWRTRAHSPIPLPVIDVGSGEGVAILKDWRERSKIRPNDMSIGLEPRISVKNFAVVVERRQPDKEPPAVEVLQPKTRDPEPVVNGTSTTVSSRASDKSTREPVSTTGPPTLAPKSNPSIPPALKRKRLELDDEEDELQADPSSFPQPKKRSRREAIRETQSSTRGTVSKARGRPKSKASTGSSVRGGRNAKVGPTPKPSARKKK